MRGTRCCRRAFLGVICHGKQGYTKIKPKGHYHRLGSEPELRGPHTPTQRARGGEAAGQEEGSLRRLGPELQGPPIQRTLEAGSRADLGEVSSVCAARGAQMQDFKGHVASRVSELCCEQALVVNLAQPVLDIDGTSLAPRLGEEGLSQAMCGESSDSAEHDDDSQRGRLG